MEPIHMSSVNIDYIHIYLGHLLSNEDKYFNLPYGDISEVLKLTVINSNTISTIWRWI